MLVQSLQILYFAEKLEGDHSKDYFHKMKEFLVKKKKKKERKERKELK